MKPSALRGLSMMAAFFTISLALACTSVNAWQGMVSGNEPTPSLHITGRFLQDQNGKNITLHGYMQPGASWFNGSGRNFRDPSDYTDTAITTPALTHYQAVADIMSDPAPRYGQEHGWYCNYVRFIGDGGSAFNFAPGWNAEGKLVKPEQFKGWIDHILVPYVQHCRERGLYVVLVGNPSVAYPLNKEGKPDEGKNMSQQYQQNLITFWSQIAAHPAIKNAGNVHFEICNEPITIESSFGANDWSGGGEASDRAITAFMQPIVTAIRAQGAENIIWIPGLGWQGQYAGFAKHPVTGSNIGYAAHIYPAYGGALDDPIKVKQLWERNYKPAADLRPMIITEMYWDPNDGKGYQGLWNASTAGFGQAIRTCLDQQGNVSFITGMIANMLDHLEEGLAKSTLSTSQAGRAGFDWYPSYKDSVPTAADGKSSQAEDPWSSDNHDGTFTNPVLHADYPDPDIIRVGDDFYLATTTFVSMPGIEILHSKDLIHWEISGYAARSIGIDPKYSLKGGNHYAGGFWAPCLRYHDGIFYIIDNVQSGGTVVFRSSNPAGPWVMNQIEGYLYDPGLMFDDDGTPRVYHGTKGDIRVSTLDHDLRKVVSSTQAYKIPDGEGSHAYKINGTYYVFNSLYGEYPTLICSRSKSPTGPFTTMTVCNNRTPWSSPHQGGIVQLPNGDWWGFSLVDSGAIGRTCWIGPVTWKDEWPYFGKPDAPSIPKMLPKPNIKAPDSQLRLPKSDDFSKSELSHQWQWNHNPDDSKWSLTARRGHLLLGTQMAPNLTSAPNTLTQRTAGPRCTGVIKIDTSHMKSGDRAGFGLLEQYFGYIAIQKDATRQRLIRVINRNGDLSKPSEDITEQIDDIKTTELWLKIQCDFTKNMAQYSYSTDGTAFTQVGDDFPMHFTLATFQGERFCLFNYNTQSSNGWIDIDSFTMTP